MKIIHAFDTRKINGINIKDPADYSFILLEKGQRKNRDALRLKGIDEIGLKKLSDEERRCFEKEYIKNISAMSSGVPPLNWWANPASEKNEHLSTHYKNICLYYGLVKTLNEYAGGNKIIFLVCNNNIYEQLSDYAKDEGINLVSLENQILSGIKQAMNDFFNILGFMVRATIKKTYTLFKAGKHIKRKLNNKSGCYILRTWLDSRYLDNGPGYRDTFFGKLPGFITARGHEVLTLANINDNYFNIINKIVGDKSRLIVPEEYFLRYRDLCRSLLHLAFKKKYIGKIAVNGLDVTRLYEKEVERGFFCAEYLKNIHRYFIAGNMAMDLQFKTYIQPYENYAWEKTSLLGIREAGSNGLLLGFQHAFISRNSFKYFPGEVEKAIIPLPDRIITMGSVTKDIMQRYGSYNKEIFTAGCALRQDYLDSLSPFERRQLRKIVVPLTMVKSESVSIIDFLYKSALAGSEIRIEIRCHPAATFDTFKNELSFSLPDNFRISSERSVRDELSDADMVLYTWTTVAIEALKMGLPVIYLDILDPVYVDPLFECRSLKREVSKPEDLLPVINELYNMDDEKFYKEQKMSQEHLGEYFFPVNEKNMLPFLHVNN